MEFYRKLCVIGTLLIIISGILFPKGAGCITIKEEEEMSREFMKVVMEHFQLIKDPIITNYVNEVGQKNVAAFPPQPFTYHFYVIKEGDYNAFASPAGHIFIFSGLLEAMDSEEELAGIISHEIAHVVCRHISQKIERSKKIGYATLAGVVAGMILGSQGSGTAANAMTIGSIAAGQSAMLAYSRDDEAQADQIGLACLNRAGYSAKGLLLMLKKIRNRQWFGKEQIPTYLQTHPASEDRMAVIDTWIATQEKISADVSPYQFQRAHTWLVAEYGDESAALRKFESDVKDHPEDPLAHYGYGLILARIGNRQDAVEQLKIALEKKAFDPYILKDIGRIYFLDGRYQEALDTFSAAGSIAAYDPEGLFYLGRTQTEMGRVKEAADTLERLITINPEYSQAYYFLGEAYGKLNRLDYAHYYLGIYYKKTANFKNATFHLQKALETMSDADKRLKIEQMLNEVRKEIAESRKRATP
ncbi:MAG: M48 family metalloprotease [Pseudomonadota bacterium]|uniref:M48 family metalloprotease n=1 Tax=Candidatus Desulfatibia profunda TaxID=2841695 RepID=A0A8J6NWN8_9BACT|nr:M48 family metalloprotease [Candidatus Desulfatibia profunda]MBL7178634.1 M48 family metalloprotease [Desulfobacterales bacterium]